MAASYVSETAWPPEGLGPRERSAGQRPNDSLFERHLGPHMGRALEAPPVARQFIDYPKPPPAMTVERLLADLGDVARTLIDHLDVRRLGVAGEPHLDRALAVLPGVRDQLTDGQEHAFERLLVDIVPQLPADKAPRAGGASWVPRHLEDGDGAAIRLFQER